MKQWVSGVCVGVSLLLASGCGGKPAEQAATVQPAAQAGVTQQQAEEAFAAAVAREEAATLDGGENLNRMTENTGKRQLSRVDLDADGSMDAVIGVVWLQNMSGDYSQQKLLAWRWQDGALVELDASEVPAGELSGFRVEGQTLFVDLLMHGADGQTEIDTRQFSIGQSRLEWQ